MKVVKYSLDTNQIMERKKSLETMVTKGNNFINNLFNNSVSSSFEETKIGEFLDSSKNFIFKYQPEARFFELIDNIDSVFDSIYLIKDRSHAFNFDIINYTVVQRLIFIGSRLYDNNNSYYGIYYNLFEEYGDLLQELRKKICLDYYNYLSYFDSLINVDRNYSYYGFETKDFFEKAKPIDSRSNLDNLTLEYIKELIVNFHADEDLFLDSPEQINMSFFKENLSDWSFGDYKIDYAISMGGLKVMKIKNAILSKITSESDFKLLVNQSKQLRLIEKEYGVETGKLGFNI